MRRLIILVLFVLITAFVWQSFNIKDVFVPISFKNNSTAKSDLSFLKEKLKDIDIVLLGEGLHFYETDGASKLKVIKYLHEEMDYDVLLMEYSFYDFYNLNNAIGKSKNYKDTALKYSRYLPKHMLDVIGYVNEQKLNGDNIDLGGVDIDMNYYGFARNPINFLVMNNKSYQNDTEVKKFYYLLQTPFNKLEKIKLFKNNETIKKIREKSISNSFFNNDSLNNYWLQIFNNLEIELFYDIQKSKLTDRLFYSKKNPSLLLLDIDDSKKRDSMMFQNFEYLKNLYPGKKIIVYTSSFHIRKSVEPFKGKRKIGNRTIPLGKYISDKYKNTYHIAWIYNSVEDKKNKKNSYFKRSSSSLESFLYKNKMGSGFIDLHDLASRGDSIFTMYPIWKFKTRGKWIDAFDAIIYMDTARAMRRYYNYGVYNDSIERTYFPPCSAMPPTNE